MAATPIRVLLELQPQGDSLTGRVHCDGHSARQFTGWLGLLAALQALVASERPGGGEQTGPE